MTITGDVNAGKGKQHKISTPLIPKTLAVNLGDAADTINDEDYSDKKLGSAVLSVTYSGLQATDVDLYFASGAAPTDTWTEPTGLATITPT